MKEFKQLNSWHWVDYDELESTNDMALCLSEDIDNSKKIVITAKMQTKGRGRCGRRWIAGQDNLYMSLLLKWNLREAGALVLILGLSLLETIKKFSNGIEACLKWPNDVLVKGKKISGILLETGKNGAIVAGIGVNIAVAPEGENILYPVTSLKDEGINCTRTEFLSVYLNKFDEVCAFFYKNGMAELSLLWQKNAKGIGEQIRVKMPKKEEKGIFCGLDNQGFLLLRCDNGGLKTIGAGDVFFDESSEKEG